mgnify:CR=1 FL=1
MMGLSEIAIRSRLRIFRGVLAFLRQFRYNTRIRFSKEERREVMNALDVLDTFLSKVGIEDITSEEGYDILNAINYQDEDVWVDDTEIVLKYEY